MEFRPIESPEVRSILEDACDAKGTIGFKKFIEIALYHPEKGYYRSNRPRVGKNRESDFFTASSLKSAFAPIVLEASLNLAKAVSLPIKELAWIEIGPEPGNQLFSEIDTPFRTKTSIALGEPLRIEGPVIVFSNELFDAQPFSSVVFRQGCWLEKRVEVGDEGVRAIECEPQSDDVLGRLPELPHPAPEGYNIDLPTGATALLEDIARLDWQGVFLAFDYGKTWQSLAFDTAQGTGRAYSSHQQRSDLLDKIGQQDITCHLCWDWLIHKLEKHGFKSIDLQSQESFILRGAPKFLKRAFEGENDQMGPLRQLVHPTMMGQKFQALSAVRKV